MPKVDNKKYKAFFGAKAKMLTPDEVTTRIGHAVGGVCPFGINDGVEVYLDTSMKRFEYMYPAAGSSNSAIKLSIPELEKYAARQRMDRCMQNSRIKPGTLKTAAGNILFPNIRRCGSFFLLYIHSFTSLS